MQGLESSLYELQVSHPGQQSARAWGPQSYNHKERNSVYNLNNRFFSREEPSQPTPQFLSFQTLNQVQLSPGDFCFETVR